MRKEGEIGMKEITINIFNQKGNSHEDPKAGELIVESSYRVVPVERLIFATKNAIITLIEKVEDEKIEWLASRIELLVNGELTSDSFYINDHFYSLSA